MIDMLILAEKGSQCRKMQKAFGGRNGTFHGKTFHLTHSEGHLFGLLMPAKYSRKDREYKPTAMLKDPKTVKRYASWSDMKTMPWNPKDFTWKKVFTPSLPTSRPAWKDIQESVKKYQPKSIVIATDDDPDTKEGDLLGTEIVQQLHWHGPLYRMRPDALTPKSLRKRLAERKNMHDKSQWGCYLKANGRSHFDYLTMPLTRIATYSARQNGYNVLANEGRLKSVILTKVYQQEQAHKNYIKKPYWEVRFQDSAGHKYARKVTDDNRSKIRHQSKADGEQALNQYHFSSVAGVTKSRTTQSPGALLNLSTLASRLSGKYSVNQITNTYEKLYMNQYVSYPRTAEKTIMRADFNELLPHVDDIAHVVGVDTSLIKHRNFDSIHNKFKGKKKEDHGANRPGTNVPSSLSAVRRKFGPCGADIYRTVAKNYLAIMCADAVYTKIKAHIADYPKFTTSYRILKQANYKNVFDTGNDDKQKWSDDMEWTDQPAKPFLHQGANPRPKAPSMPWILGYLQKMNVGTAATQDATLGQLCKRGKNQKLKARGKKLTMTQAGRICAVLAENTYIGDAKMTQQLSKDMDKVMNYEWTDSQLENMATKVIDHDKPIIIANGSKLAQAVGKPNKNSKAKPKISNIKSTPIGITCPKCKKGQVQAVTLTRGNETYSFYGCSNRSCRFYTPLSFCGTKITPTILQQIIKGTLPFKKYVSPRTHKSFPAKLYWSRGKIQLKFPPRKQRKPTTSLGIKCPKCHKGNLGLYEFTSKKGKHIKSYQCDNPKCNFFTFTSMAGFKFTPDRMKHIVKGDLPAQSLTSKNGKPYSATFKYSRGKIKMKFVNNR